MAAGAWSQPGRQATSLGWADRSSLNLRNHASQSGRVGLLRPLALAGGSGVTAVVSSNQTEASNWRGIEQRE